MISASLHCCRTASLLGLKAARPLRLRRALLAPRASKGFSAESTEASSTKQEPNAATTAPEAVDEIGIESKIRSRRKRANAAPKVKVVNATLEAAKQAAAEGNPQSQADAVFVSVLALLFVVILLEGLIVAGSGFLSDELDLMVQNYVYPAFTPTVGVFIACSAFYGLFKTGKLPGQKQL